MEGPGVVERAPILEQEAVARLITSDCSRGFFLENALPNEDMSCKRTTSGEVDDMFL